MPKNLPLVKARSNLKLKEINKKVREKIEIQQSEAKDRRKRSNTI